MDNIPCKHFYSSAGNIDIPPDSGCDCPNWDYNQEEEYDGPCDKTCPKYEPVPIRHCEKHGDYIDYCEECLWGDNP